MNSHRIPAKNPSDFADSLFRTRIWSCRRRGAADASSSFFIDNTFVNSYEDMLTRHFYTPMNLTVGEGLNQFCQFSIAEFFQLMAVMCLCTKFVNKNPFASLVAYITSIKIRTLFHRPSINKYEINLLYMVAVSVAALYSSTFLARATRSKFLVLETWSSEHACKPILCVWLDSSVLGTR